MTESGSARIIIDDIPEDDELLELYSAVGWTAYTKRPGGLAAAILGSSFVVTARADGGALVGLARAVSDERTICYLQDVLVHPAWRRRGIGRRLFAAVESRYVGIRQFVLLTDDDPAQRMFYSSLGLTRSDERGLYAYLR